MCASFGNHVIPTGRSRVSLGRGWLSCWDMSLVASAWVAWVTCLLAATHRGLPDQERSMSWNLAHKPRRKPFHPQATLRLRGRLPRRLAVPSALALAGTLLVISPAARSEERRVGKEC